MNQPILYYNAKCGSCRSTLELLQKKGYKPDVREYLKEPPSIAELKDVLKKLALEPEALVRQKEPLYRQLSKTSCSAEDWLRAMVEHPELIQRPIVVWGSRAVIARPPEMVEKLFD